MWQRLSTRFLLMVASAASLANGASQAGATATPPTETKNSLIVSLLEQSHDLDQQFSPTVHLDLLNRQANMVSRVPGDASAALARQWANELFALAAQANQPVRSYVQGSALNILARLEPNRALELLRTAQLEETGPPSPRLALERQVFDSLVTSGGVSVLPVLQQEADQIGAQGQYPYAALAGAANYAVAKEWRDNRQHAIQVLRSVFEPAFARYNQSPPDYPNDYEFGEMLRVMADGLPFEIIQPALRIFVKNLLAADTSKYHYQAHVFSQNGEDFQTNNAPDAAIMWFGTLINRDPELVQQLQAAKPELQAVLECFRINRCHGGSFGRGGQTQTGRVPDPDAETRAAAVRLSYTDPDLAITKVESLLTNDKRAATELDVVRGIAGRRPGEAAQMIDKAQNAGGSEDNRKELNVISAQVSVAAAQNQQDQLRQLLQRGFDLAGPLVGQLPSPGAQPFIPGLPPMVQIAMQNYPDMTLDFLKSLPPVRVKADLLIAAAAALQLPAKLPSGSAAQPSTPITKR